MKLQLHCYNETVPLLTVHIEAEAASLTIYSDVTSLTVSKGAEAAPLLLLH